MNAHQVWAQVEALKNYIISWAMWLLGVVFPIVLVLLVLKGSEAGRIAARYMTMPNDAQFWLMAAGIWWLIRDRK